jgi:Rieske Fe-S protein
MIDRRQFVELGLCGAAGAALLPLAGCASLAAVRMTPENGTLRLAVRNHPALDRPGGHLKVAADGVARPIYVVAQDDGSYLALSSECTHLKCTVELEGARIVCPCHGSTFDRAGEVLVGPAERPLARYSALLREDGVLEISL